jgi:hypothetical protein
LNLQRTFWAGNSANIYTGTGSGTVTDNNPVSAASANFVSPGAPNYDYHIKKTSAAKDAATGSASGKDMDDQARPWFGAPDIGADEYVPIVLSDGLVARGKVLLTWWVDSALVSGVASYEISLTCPPGAACPGPLNAGAANQYVVSGLTNGKPYTMWVTAKTSSNQTIDVSNSIVLTPMEHFVYLPSVVR